MGLGLSSNNFFSFFEYPKGYTVCFMLYQLPVIREIIRRGQRAKKRLMMLPSPATPQRRPSHRQSVGRPSSIDARWCTSRVPCAIMHHAKDPKSQKKMEKSDRCRAGVNMRLPLPPAKRITLFHSTKTRYATIQLKRRTSLSS